jgi:transposase, IS5 family
LGSTSYCQRQTHKRYEFGTKASVARTRDSRNILGALALPGIPTMVIPSMRCSSNSNVLRGTQPDILIADRGYRGEKYFGNTQLLTPSRPARDDTKYKNGKQRKRLRKRAGIEATISHLKHDFRLGRCFLKGEVGDQINVTLSSAAYNLRKWIRFRLEIFSNLFYKTLKNVSCRNLKYYLLSF